MIELIMFFAIGFLVAALLGLIIIPVVHNRAVRLTARRIETSTPLATAEIYADKDQLRADYAMSARRLEMIIEEFKVKNTNQLAELGRKTDALNRLKLELDEKTVAILALETSQRLEQFQAHAHVPGRSHDGPAANAELLGQSTQEDRVSQLEQQLATQITKTKILDAENAQFQSELTQMRIARDRLADEITDLQRDAGEKGKAEEIEIPFLRKRINDIAVDIAILISALENPGSSVNTVMTNEKPTDGATATTASVMRLSTINQAASDDFSDRIRALQAQASKPRRDEQKA